MSGALKYLYNPVIKSINGQTDGALDIMRKQRIKNKSGIIGHVAFCGLATAVQRLDGDPRRCYAYEDKELGLNSVMFCPLADTNDDAWGVIMVNRLAGIFRYNEVDRLETVVNKYNGYIIRVLKKYSMPYFG
jgi:hypothetical protein